MFLKLSSLRRQVNVEFDVTLTGMFVCPNRSSDSIPFYHLYFYSIDKTGKNRLPTLMKIRILQSCFLLLVIPNAMAISQMERLSTMSTEELAGLSVDNLNNITNLTAKIESETANKAEQAAREVFEQYYQINIYPEIENVLRALDELSLYEETLTEYEVNDLFNK